MSKEIKVITHELLKLWDACDEGYKRFCELFPDGADLKTAIKGLVKDNHDEWGYWLFLKCKEKELFKDIVAMGYRNTGNCNTGNYNTGDCNTGNCNTGNCNTGDCNTGDCNTGDCNTGNRNTGDCNTGYCNTGNYNTGDWNTGNYNTGDWNTGNRNTGNRNTGDWNTGNWNTGDCNTGFFNTQTPDEILIFNKSCSRLEWENAYKPSFLFFYLTYWVNESDMTDQEKAADPNFYIRGGQLRKRDYKEAFKLSWENADPADRIRVKDLPNFDAQIFFEISGIDLRA